MPRCGKKILLPPTGGWAGRHAATSDTRDRVSSKKNNARSDSCWQLISNWPIRYFLASSRRQNTRSLRHKLDSRVARSTARVTKMEGQSLRSRLEPLSSRFVGACSQLHAQGNVELREICLETVSLRLVTAVEARSTEGWVETEKLLRSLFPPDLSTQTHETLDFLSVAEDRIHWVIKQFLSNGNENHFQVFAQHDERHRISHLRMVTSGDFPARANPTYIFPSSKKLTFCRSDADKQLQVGLAREFIEACSVRDFSKLRTLCADTISFRSATPAEILSSEGWNDTEPCLQALFPESERITRIKSIQTEPIVDMLHLFYRFVGVEGDQPFEYRHHAYMHFTGEKISQFRVICSGFYPPSPA